MRVIEKYRDWDIRINDGEYSCGHRKVGNTHVRGQTRKFPIPLERPRGKYWYKDYHKISSIAKKKIDNLLDHNIKPEGREKVDR